MKLKLLSAILMICFLQEMAGQNSCDELMAKVQTEDYGTIYSSFNSDAITQVTFHEFSDSSYNTYYFAIVQFTSSYQEYIYQVDSDTEFNYSLDYYSSAGKAFWKHINPFKDVLGCAPNIN